jgi:AmmeMemoRadiSam system protein B
MVGLRDPLQISPQILGVSPDVAFILQFFDGAHTLEEIRAKYRKRFQRELPIDQLHQMVQTLDRSYFLENETFRNYFTTLADSFRRSEIREAFHAGISYPNDPVGLSQSLSGFFSPPRGPGLPAAEPAQKSVIDTAPDTAQNTTIDRASKSIRGAIVPHIDLRIGGPTYAWAYKKLIEGGRPDLVIILGTAHNGLKSLFSLTRKRFATPLGDLSVDAPFVDRLLSLYPHDLFSDEFAHRTEHTIEFQAIFLRLLFGENLPVVPILASFAHSMARQGEGAEIVRRFTDALRTAVREDGRRICLIASADLAHVGPRYGDTERFSGEALDRIKQADREMLSFAGKVDAEGFLDYIAREEDRRRICGLPPIYTLLKVLDEGRGTLLAHDHGEMDMLGSICSYASMVIE